ncbi:probable arsenate reductase [unidentified eubacterium SCB49]|nr:probable arsenate reductase [unidentified eubacterium SCB49]
MHTTKTKVLPELEKLISGLNVQSISAERKIILQPLLDYIQQKVTHKQDVRVNFICTHNSRRSHLSQIWAQTMAGYFGLKNVFCYSAGTERTALFPMIAETLSSAGFQINQISEGTNPVYSIKYAANEHPIIGFSKTLENAFNPNDDFAAVMTCDAANEACPFVPGAEKRIPITFEDPKAFDNTPQQAQKYSERSQQIATELFYIFSQINF